MEYECAHFISKIISLSRSLKLSLPIFRPNLFDFLPSFIYRIRFFFSFQTAILQHDTTDLLRLLCDLRYRIDDDVSMIVKTKWRHFLSLWITSMWSIFMFNRQFRSKYLFYISTWYNSINNYLNWRKEFKIQRKTIT